MATSQTTARPLEEIGEYRRSPSWKARLMVGAVIVTVLSLATVAYLISHEETTQASVSPAVSETPSREAIMRDLVNRGLVPSPALEPLSRQDVLRDLVNRGVIPSQTLEPIPLSREDVLRDLVNRGVIPPQSLDE